MEACWSEAHVNVLYMLMYCSERNCSILRLNLFRDLMTLSIAQAGFPLTISGQIFAKHLILRGYKLMVIYLADLHDTYQIQTVFSR